MLAEGWYLDPYEAHEQRWFSSGNPTSLVRDGTTESHDDPPGPLPPLPLVEVAPADFGYDDIIRADELESVSQEGKSMEATGANFGWGAVAAVAAAERARGRRFRWKRRR